MGCLEITGLLTLPELSMVVGILMKVLLAGESGGRNGSIGRQDVNASKS